MFLPFTGRMVTVSDTGTGYEYEYDDTVLGSVYALGTCVCQSEQRLVLGV